MIPLQFALRRRMMSKKPAPQWTLTVAGAVSKYLTVSINGESLTAGSYVVDDGTIAHFEAYGSITNSIYLDGVKVDASSHNDKSSYDLVMHANYTAKATDQTLVTKWEITTQP